MAAPLIYVFKSHDPARQATSVRYQDGSEDGREDAITASLCPPGYPEGYRPEYASSSMYRTGYDDHFQPMPCPCDGSCKSGKQYGEAPEAS